MKKGLCLIISSLLLLVCFAYAQQDDNLKSYPVERGVKNAVFDKAFSGIIASEVNYFKDLHNDTRITSIIDKSYSMSFSFNEKNDGTLTCEKTYVSLAIRFSLNDADFKMFFNNLNTSLPGNFVYTRKYDPSVKIASFTFFPKTGSKTIPSNYPEKIYMTRDADDIVLLSFLKYR